MHIMMVTFDFQGADLDAEERHYRDVHMALARQFSGVNMYLAGRIRDTRFAFTPAPEVAANMNTRQLGKLGLSDDEENAIVAFMKTLTDGYVKGAK